MDITHPPMGMLSSSGIVDFSSSAAAKPVVNSPSQGSVAAHVSLSDVSPVPYLVSVESPCRPLVPNPVDANGSSQGPVDQGQGSASPPQQPRIVASAAVTQVSDDIVSANLHFPAIDLTESNLPQDPVSRLMNAVLFSSSQALP